MIVSEVCERILNSCVMPYFDSYCLYKDMIFHKFALLFGAHSLCIVSRRLLVCSGIRIHDCDAFNMVVV